MEPAIREGESWLINKTNQNYQKNDIITFYSNDEQKKMLLSQEKLSLLKEIRFI